jgi:hypothetical protein
MSTAPSNYNTHPAILIAPIDEAEMPLDSLEGGAADSEDALNDRFDGSIESNQKFSHNIGQDAARLLIEFFEPQLSNRVAIDRNNRAQRDAPGSGSPLLRS